MVTTHDNILGSLADYLLLDQCIFLVSEGAGSRSSQDFTTFGVAAAGVVCALHLACIGLCE